MEVGEMKTKLEGYKALETETKKLNGILLSKEKEIEVLRKTADDAKQEKIELIKVGHPIRDIYCFTYKIYFN